MTLAGRRLPCALNSILGISVQVRVLGLLGLGVRWYMWPELQLAEEGCSAIYSSSLVSNCTISAPCCRAGERMDEVLLRS